MTIEDGLGQPFQLATKVAFAESDGLNLGLHLLKGKAYPRHKQSLFVTEVVIKGRRLETAHVEDLSHANFIISAHREQGLSGLKESMASARTMVCHDLYNGLYITKVPKKIKKSRHLH